MFDEPTATLDWKHRGFFAKAGDARQVWARSAKTQEIFYLAPHGVTSAIRDACRQGLLICPMSDCPDPHFTARGGTERRHHFAHRIAHTKHTSRRVFTSEAAEMLADWVRSFSGMTARIESVGEHTDVVVTSTKSGKRVQLRVTYDRSYDPSAEELLDPHRQLVLGHTKGLLLPREPFRRRKDAWWCGAPRLLSDVILYTKHAIAINPQERLVGTIVNASHGERIGFIDRGFVVSENVCFVEELDNCALTEGGIVSAALARFRQLDQAHESRWQVRSPTSRAPADRRQAEFLRRAEGKSTEERLALIHEIFLPDTDPP